MLLGLAQTVKDKQDQLPPILAIVGAITYFLQSITYAFTLLSVEDEGGYLLKGYWYVTGQYVPFQDYGPFTNHMPLAFIIPGYIQKWFGTGLRTGRFFAVLLGMLFLFGLWLLVRRLAGRWWAAAAVWAIVLNPAVIKMYSVAVSQGLVAAMLVWVLYFALGKDRLPAQLYLGAALAAALALTRLNMTPVLLLLLVYIWWQHGARIAVISAGIGLGITTLGYASYWPGVLRLWATYTPESFSPFLEAWRLPPEALPSWISGTPLLGRLLSFIEAWRFNFLPFLAALSAWILWPNKDAWRDKYQHRDAVFISFLLAILLLMHAYASLASNYCVFCFPLYSAFFSFLGILLFVLVWPKRLTLLSQSRNITIRVLLFLLPALLSFGSYSLLADKLPPRAWVRSLLILELPRFSGFSSLPGTIPLWGLLENRFALDYEASFRALRIGMGYAIMLLLGLAIGLALYWIARRAPEFLAKKPNINVGGFASSAILTLFVAGLLLSPTPVLGGGYSSFDCNRNMIAAYEEIGEELSSQIPVGTEIFWRGGRSPVPLLYLENVHFPPAQVNGDYTYRLAGQADDLQRFGMWGPSVLEDWLQNADYILVEEDLYRSWLQTAMEDGPYELLYTTDQLVDCSPQSQILIYTYRPD